MGAALWYQEWEEPSCRNVNSKIVWFCLKNISVGSNPSWPQTAVWTGSAPAEQSYTLGSTPKGLWRALAKVSEECKDLLLFHFNPLLWWNKLQQSKDFLPVQLHLDEESACTVMSISFGKRGKIHSSANKILNDSSGQNFSHIYREVQRKYPLFDRLT